MTQNDAKITETNDKKETKSSIFDKVLGIKEAKVESFSNNAAGSTVKDAKESLECKVVDLTNSLQRLQAEFENFQKRNAKQNDEYKIFANAKLIEDFLPVLDSLEQGMTHSKDLVILYNQITGILKKKGLEKIQIKKGEIFNHDEMECLMQESDPKLPVDAVVNVLMQGYKLNGKILRLARVSVNTLEKKCIIGNNTDSDDNDDKENKKEVDNMAQENKNKEKLKEKKDDSKEKCEDVKEKNEHEGITKCDFEIKIMESD